MTAPVPPVTQVTHDRVDKSDGLASSVSALYLVLDSGGSGRYRLATLASDGLAANGENLVLHSESFGTDWSDLGIPCTRTPSAVVQAGISLDLIGDTSAVGAAEGYFQQILYRDDGFKALSVYVKQGTSSAAGGSNINIADGVAGLDANLTWTAGLPVVAMTHGTYLGYDDIGGGVFRLRFTAALVNASLGGGPYLSVAPAAIAAQTGNLYAGGWQAENAPIPTIYRKTTTATLAPGLGLVFIGQEPAIRWQGCGDGSWSQTGTPTRTPAAFTCADGTVLDLVGDTDVAIYAQFYKIFALQSDGTKGVRFRIKKSSSYAHHGVFVYDITSTTFPLSLDIDFTGSTPIVTAQTGGIIELVDRGDTSWEVFCSAVGYVHTDVTALTVQMAGSHVGGLASDMAQLYIGGFELFEQIAPPYTQARKVVDTSPQLASPLRYFSTANRVVL